MESIRGFFRGSDDVKKKSETQTSRPEPMDPLHPTADQRDVVRWETAKNRGGFAKDGREEVSVYPTFGPVFFLFHV